MTAPWNPWRSTDDSWSKFSFSSSVTCDYDGDADDSVEGFKRPAACFELIVVFFGRVKVVLSSGPSNGRPWRNERPRKSRNNSCKATCVRIVAWSTIYL